jgi:predicted regulator of Ras-like GTPase activity (Roadblock/LC7/MglB family)
MNPSTLHEIPLMFTAVQRQQMDQSLMRLADRIAAPLVMVADVSGRLVLYRGRLSAAQSTALAALAAGSFGAGVEMGNFLGLRNANAFRQQLHEGAAANLYTLAVGEELLLIIAFTGQTTLGLVRVYAQKAQKELLEMAGVASIARDKAVEGGLLNLNQDADEQHASFGDQVSQQLDDLFSL